MADSFPGEIHFGGPIPRNILNELVREIIATDASLDGYAGEDAVAEDTVRQAFQESRIIDLYDDRARYGRFEELEEFLVKHGIHFDAHRDSYCEYDAENVYYRGGQGVLSLAANQVGHILIHREDIMSILNNNDLGADGKLHALTKLVDPPEIRPLEPMRFG